MTASGKWQRALSSFPLIDCMRAFGLYASCTHMLSICSARVGGSVCFMSVLFIATKCCRKFENVRVVDRERPQGDVVVANNNKIDCGKFCVPPFFFWVVIEASIRSFCT